MKFSIRVLDISGAKPSTEASRGPHHSALPMLIPREKAEAFFGALSPSGSRDGVRVPLPLPAAEPDDAYSVWQGIYTRDVDVAPGEYLLVVSAKDKMPVFQRLTLSERGGLPLAAAGWAQLGHPDANRQAMSIEFPRGSQGAKSGESQRVLLVVKLYMQVEFVLVAETSFWHELPSGSHDHTHYGAFSKHRRNQLFEQQEMLAGYRVTEFDLLDRRRRTWVKAVGDAKTWLLVAETHTDHQTLEYTKDRAASQVHADNINILDVYSYLDGLGKSAPGSVWSVEFFGHAWQKGPLLWNTDEDPEFFEPDEQGRTRPGHDRAVDRDPKDHDPRPKDFGPGVLPKFPSLAAAHLHKAVWRIWGCNVRREVIAAAAAARDQLGPELPEHQLFRYNYGASYEEQLTLAHLMWKLSDYVKNGYAAAAIKGLGREIGCYAAPLGFGASLGSGMFITRKRAIVEGTSKGTGPDDLGLAHVYALYRRFLSKAYLSAGIERQDGYFEIRWLLDEMATWPEPVWTPARYWWHGKTSTTRFASGTYCTSKERAQFRPNISDRAGLISSGHEGWLFVFERAAVSEADKDGVWILTRAADDVALYQQDDGSLFVMKRVGREDWVVDQRPISRKDGEEPAHGLLAEEKRIF